MVEDVPKGTGVVVEIPKSLRTPRPKKDKQAIAPVRVSSRNPLCSKLSMTDKGKAIMIDIDEEEEYLQALIIRAK